MTTKEKFISRFNDEKKYIVDCLEKALERAVGNNAVNYAACEDNYYDIYPLVAAVLQKEIENTVGGSMIEGRRRSQKRKMREYRRDFRIWADYAGDYRTLIQETTI